MKREGHYFVFQDGRKIYAHRGILGIDYCEHDKNNNKEISYGYDGFVSEYYVGDDFIDTSEISDIHILEICEYMIHEWFKFKLETIEKIKEEKNAIP